MTLGPGALINGKYRLGQLLGEGGMGAVYEARHEFLGTEVALKFLHPALSSRPHVVARFVQEARVSANIRSPHVVTVIDVDQSPQGLAFLVMELLHGEALSTRLAREPVLPVPLATAIGLQILLALERAHALGVVHRDMKPENVFLTDAPGSEGANDDGLLVKVLDFGIAKLRAMGEVRAQLTRPGQVMGTPEYMAPEQVFSADEVDARADLYAVGAMLFEMMAGQRPFANESAHAVAARVLAAPARRLDSLVPAVPGGLSDVVAMALAARPNERFSSALAMRKALVSAARDGGIPLDVPRSADRTRSSPELRAGSREGVPPPAMLGPGDPRVIAAYDGNPRAGAPPSAKAPPSESAPVPNGSAAPPVRPHPVEPTAVALVSPVRSVSKPASPAAVPVPAVAADARPADRAPAPAPVTVPAPPLPGPVPSAPATAPPATPVMAPGVGGSDEADSTLVAAPTPWVPPVAPKPDRDAPVRVVTLAAEGRPLEAGPRADVTDAGFRPPYAVGPSATADREGARWSDGGTNRGQFNWGFFALGTVAVTAAVGILLAYLLTGPSSPAPTPSATEDTAATSLPPRESKPKKTVPTVSDEGTATPPPRESKPPPKPPATRTTPTTPTRPPPRASSSPPPAASSSPSPPPPRLPPLPSETITIPIPPWPIPT